MISSSEPTMRLSEASPMLPGNSPFMMTVFRVSKVP